MAPMLKEVNIKNRTLYYFDDIIKIEDFDFDNVLIDEKSYKNILFYDISYKNLFSSKPLRTSFDEVDRLIRAYDEIRYLVLSAPRKHDDNYNRIRYLISHNSSIKYTFAHNYTKIKVDSYDSLPLEKALTFCNVITLIKSVLNKIKITIITIHF